MDLELGMRVRCVFADNYQHVVDEGREYTISAVSDNQIKVIELHGWHYSYRFKPIVRVKAKCVPTLDLLIKRAVAAVERMTPAEKDAMHKAQRESWARGEAALGLENGDRHIFTSARY